MIPFNREEALAGKPVIYIINRYDPFSQSEMILACDFKEYKLKLQGKLQNILVCALIFDSSKKTAEKENLPPPYYKVSLFNEKGEEISDGNGILFMKPIKESIYISLFEKGPKKYKAYMAPYSPSEIPTQEIINKIEQLEDCKFLKTIEIDIP